MAYEGYVVTKMLHVFFAVAWLGGALLWNVLVVPQLQKLGPPAGPQAMFAMFEPFLKYGNAMGGLTVLTGLGLVSMHPSSGGWGALLDTLWGRLVAFAIIGSLAMLYLINVAIAPTARKIMEVMKDMPAPPADRTDDAPPPPPPGIQLLQKRLVFSGRLVLIIGLIVLVAMVAANSSPLLQA